MAEESRAFVLGKDEGTSISYLGGVATFKITDEQTGSWGFSVETFPAGFASALHSHPTEDSGFFVLSGEMRIKCGEVDAVAGEGSFIFLPRGVPHAFKVGASGPATWINVQGPTGDFRRYVEEIGEPVGTSAGGTAPADSEKFAAAWQRHRLEVLGPPPFDS